MPLTSSMVGTRGPACSEILEDRWVMNYAAAVFDQNPTYYDNTNGRRLPAHPTYLSHQEWEAISALHERLGGLTPQERLRGVHTYNDTHLYRPLHSGEKISCVATVAAVEQHRAGAQLTVRIDTTGADGAPIASSLTTTIFRGVGLDGPPSGTVPTGDKDPGLEAWPADPTRVEHITISPLAAHVFSECARDYNPIHTDIAVATNAGLPGLILHGTGTFAIALSSVTNHEAGGDPTVVRRFGGRLAAMVLCPSHLRLEVRTHLTEPSRHQFQMLTEEGRRALGNGFLTLEHPAHHDTPDTHDRSTP